MSDMNTSVGAGWLRSDDDDGDILLMIAVAVNPSNNIRSTHNKFILTQLKLFLFIQT